MFAPHNYVWKCDVCGEEIHAHQDEKFIRVGMVPPKCPKGCKGEMSGHPMIHDGPPKHPWKHY